MMTIAEFIVEHPLWIISVCSITFALFLWIVGGMIKVEKEPEDHRNDPRRKMSP